MSSKTDEQMPYSLKKEPVKTQVKQKVINRLQQKKSTRKL